MTLCGICFNDKSTCFTNCNHYFCKTCISTWLDIKQNCPSCRAYVNKNQLTNILHTLTKIKTRSETLEYRKWKLLTSVDHLLESMKTPGPISYKINIIDDLLKISYSNFIIIKNDTDFSKYLFKKCSLKNLKLILRLFLIQNTQSCS